MSETKPGKLPEHLQMFKVNELPQGSMRTIKFWDVHVDEEGGVWVPEDAVTSNNLTDYSSVLIERTPEGIVLDLSYVPTEHAEWNKCPVDNFFPHSPYDLPILPVSEVVDNDEKRLMAAFLAQIPTLTEVSTHDS